MFWLKACSRCGGDLFSDRDPYGAYISCMQCGRYMTEDEETELKLPAPMRKAQPVVLPPEEEEKEEEKVAA